MLRIGFLFIFIIVIIIISSWKYCNNLYLFALFVRVCSSMTLTLSSFHSLTHSLTNIRSLVTSISLPQRFLVHEYLTESRHPLVFAFVHMYDGCPSCIWANVSFFGHSPNSSTNVASRFSSLSFTASLNHSITHSLIHSFTHLNNNTLLLHSPLSHSLTVFLHLLYPTPALPFLILSWLRLPSINYCIIPLLAYHCLSQSMMAC